MTYRDKYGAELSVTIIKRIVDSIDREKIMKTRQKTLRRLVKKHGLEQTAAAMGLLPSTVRQNQYTKTPMIGLDPLYQAMQILEHEK